MQKMIERRANGSRRVALICDAGSVVEGHHKNDVDINTIMHKYRVTGLLESNASEANYGDFTNATDYHDMKSRIIDAEMDFSKLPAYIRTRFNNDPGELLSFLDDPENLSEAQELGLATRPEPDAPCDHTAPVEPPSGLVPPTSPDSA